MDVKSSEVCKRFGITQQTLYLWIKKGMPHKRLITGQYRFDIEEIEKWQSERK